MGNQETIDKIKKNPGFGISNSDLDYKIASIEQEARIAYGVPEDNRNTFFAVSVKSKDLTSASFYLLEVDPEGQLNVFSLTFTPSYLPQLTQLDETEKKEILSKINKSPYDLTIFNIKSSDGFTKEENPHYQIVELDEDSKKGYGIENCKEPNKNYFLVTFKPFNLTCVLGVDAEGNKNVYQLNAQVKGAESFAKAKGPEFFAKVKELEKVEPTISLSLLSREVFQANSDLAYVYGKFLGDINGTHPSEQQELEQAPQLR